MAADQMKYECDCGQIFTDSKALSLCVQNNHGWITRRPEKRFDLKRIFMELGNRLVQEHGFDPSQTGDMCDSSELVAARCTFPLVYITEFFNNHEEARQLLFELGGKWPMPPVRNPEDITGQPLVDEQE